MSVSKVILSFTYEGVDFNLDLQIEIAEKENHKTNEVTFTLINITQQKAKTKAAKEVVNPHNPFEFLRK